MDPLTIIPLVLALIFLMIMMSFVASTYQKCPPNTAMIISGLGAMEAGRPYKIVVGGGSVVFPLLQMRSFVSLEVVDRKLDLTVSTANGFVRFEGNFLYKVGADSDSIATAAENFLSMTEDEIAEVTASTLAGHFRSHCERLNSEEVRANATDIVQRVKNDIITDLLRLGLKLVNLNVHSVTPQESSSPPDNGARLKVREKDREPR